MQEHYMIKEIKEGPEAIRRTLNYLKDKIADIKDIIERREIKTGFIIGSGTSFHASLVLQYLINKFTNLRTVSVPASEFCAWAPQNLRNELVTAFSQSGESTDVIISVKYAKEKGATVIGITNTPGSTLTRLSDISLITQAGEEKAITATKTYDAQLLASSLLAYNLADKEEYIKKLTKVPEEVNEIIKKEKDIDNLAKSLTKTENVFVLGRGINYPNALEASLKLKEAAMIHAEGFAVREFLHGPIQLVDEATPVIVILPGNKSLEESRKTLDKLKGYNAFVIAICGENVNVEDYAKHTIRIPMTEEEFSIFTSIKVLQILSYYTSIHRGLNPDKPTKLTKVVK